MNLTYVPTSVVVAVVVDGFIVGKFWFLAPLVSHGWYRPWLQRTWQFRFSQFLRSSTSYESFATFISRLRKSFAVSYGAPIPDNLCFEFANYSWAPCDFVCLIQKLRSNCLHLRNKYSRTVMPSAQLLNHVNKVRQTEL